jgi:uncharacterized protein (TIGR00297 family)
LLRSHQSRVANVTALGFAAGLTILFLGLHRMDAPVLALGITTAFALAAWLSHGVTASGALAGASVAFVMSAADPKLFGVLVVVFAVTFAATRLGSPRKEQLRVAEPRSGRSASQVMANLGVAGLIVAAAPAGWYLLALAALAEVAADTSSSETGQGFPGKTVLITTWKPVPVGLDGGISLNGTAAAIVAAVIVALTARLTGLASNRQAAIIVGSGIFGMLVDSVLGAVFERRGYLNNDLVNLFGTMAAAGIAWLLM